jgi:XTP/dITP diphosphohydrolase
MMNQESRKRGKSKNFRSMTRLVIATRNAHKTREFAQLLGNNFAIVDLNSFPQIETIEETGQSFEENAITKAVQVSREIVDLVVADDSGLEVDVLEGAPGVFSARYAGERASDKENLDKLLRELARRNIPLDQRAARFRCALVLAKDGVVLHESEGSIEGNIAEQAKGLAGFGYDPIFVPNGFDRTFAELSPKVKNRISHRALAVLAMREVLLAKR